MQDKMRFNSTFNFAEFEKTTTLRIVFVLLFVLGFNVRVFVFVRDNSNSGNTNGSVTYSMNVTADDKDA